MLEHSPYDAVPYPGSPDADSHPRRLAGIATLLGMAPADVRHCRLLELGCAAGRGLLPMAQGFPDSQFVGVDIAGERIREAAAIATTLGLKNVDFRHGSLDEIDDSWGQFDYILCLGVLTWTTPRSQQHIFEILRRNLAAEGVAVIGYNVFPGWHQRNLTRDAMRFFTRATPEPSTKIAQARSILELLAEASSSDAPHGQMLRSDRDYLRRSHDDYLYHDYLTADNQPIYFHDFYRRLVDYQLQYLGETNFVRNGIAAATPQMQELLEQLPYADRCQLLDFLRNESYRKSLVCHRGSSMEVAGAAARMKRLQIALRELPSPQEFAVANTDSLTIRYSSGSIQVAAPFGKAALRHLVSIYPRTASIAELHQAAGEMLQLSDGGQRWVDSCDIDQLAGAMVSSFYAGLVQPCVSPPAYCDQLSETPRVSPLTRHLASLALRTVTPRGLDTVNECHEIVSLSRVTTLILAHLDGTRTRSDLAILLEHAVATGEMEVDLSAHSLLEHVDEACAEICAFRFLC